MITITSASTVSSVSISPSGSFLSPSTPVTVSYLVGASGFPSAHDLQSYTELEDPHWTYTIIVNGVENLRPSLGGHNLTLTGFELAFKTSDSVSVRATLTGNIPASASPSQILLKVQELDSSSNVITSDVYIREMPVTPTPTPTPAYGSISVSSTPPGANIYLDNAIKGLTPLPMEGITNGNHIVIVKLTGYLDWTQNVVVLSNSTSLNAILVAITNTTATPTPTPALNSTVNGSIYVQSSPTNSKVFLNNVYQGYTPMTLYNITPGNPLVTVRRALYNDWSQNVVVTAGNTTSISASLVLSPEVTTTIVTTTPLTTVTTVRTTVKSTTKLPTPWPTDTPTQSTPLGIEIGIIATIGAALVIIGRK